MQFLKLVPGVARQARDVLVEDPAVTYSGADNVPVVRPGVVLISATIVGVEGDVIGNDDSVRFGGYAGDFSLDKLPTLVEFPNISVEGRFFQGRCRSSLGSGQPDRSPHRGRRSRQVWE